MWLRRPQAACLQASLWGKETRVLQGSNASLSTFRLMPGECFSRADMQDTVPPTQHYEARPGPAVEAGSSAPRARGRPKPSLPARRRPLYTAGPGVGEAGQPAGSPSGTSPLWSPYRKRSRAILTAIFTSSSIRMSFSPLARPPPPGPHGAGPPPPPPGAGGRGETLLGLDMALRSSPRGGAARPAGVRSMTGTDGHCRDWTAPQAA